MRQRVLRIPARRAPRDLGGGGSNISDEENDQRADDQGLKGVFARAVYAGPLGESRLSYKVT
jgi:hypothetical protein